MAFKTMRAYYFFLVLIFFNIAVYYMFIGQSQLYNNTHPEINYLTITSAALVIIWFVYYLCRRKLSSVSLLWSHLIFVGICILVVPIFTIDSTLLPRRFLERSEAGFQYAEIFGFMKTAAIAQICLLLLSMLFLIFNVRR
jgi:magnesium-transporting ATPase (P-type)